MKAKKYKVLSQLLQRSRAIGGQLAFISGEQGSGKTTLMLQLLNSLYKHDVCVWRGLFSAQFRLFPYQEDVVLLIQRNLSLKVYIIAKDAYEKVKLGDLNYRVVRFHKVTDIESKLKKGKLNVIYMDVESWRKWLARLPQYRRYAFWLTLGIDEIHEISPSYPKGELWHQVQELAQGIADYRKRYINALFSSQQPDDTDHRIRKKVQHRVLMRGSRVEGYLRLWQKAVDNLNRGEAYICTGHFEKFEFKALDKPNFDLQIEF